MQKNEIIIYQSDDQTTHIEVKLEQETLWLSQPQIIELFDSSKANISEHIKNIFLSKELDKKSTVRNFRTVQIEGKRSVKREILHYNLDMIISIGYRVNSIRGTQFRIWANKILKDYLLKGYAVNHRFDRIENDIDVLKRKVDEFDFQVKSHLPPNEGIFFDGQIFDAYIFVSDLIKSAKESIVLIDNYLDDSVLTLVSKRKENVSALIFTANLSKQLQLDLHKHNAQYPKIEIKKYKNSHDRFLIIDQSIVYHIGASLKDLGKRWFAFSKIKIDADILLSKLI